MLIGCQFEHVAVYTQCVNPRTARDDYDYPEAVIKLRNGDYLSLNAELLTQLASREQGRAQRDDVPYSAELEKAQKALAAQQKKLNRSRAFREIGIHLGWGGLFAGCVVASVAMLSSAFDSKIARKYEGEPVEVNGQTFRVKPRTGIVSTGSPSKGVTFDFSRAARHRACVTSPNPDAFPHPSFNLLSELQEACGPVMAFKEGEQPRRLEAAAFAAYRQVAYSDAPRLTVDEIGQLLAQQRRIGTGLRPQ